MCYVACYSHGYPEPRGHHPGRDECTLSFWLLIETEKVQDKVSDTLKVQIADERGTFSRLSIPSRIVPQDRPTSFGNST